MSCRAAARRYEVSELTAIKWLERYRRDGLRGPVGHGGHRPSALMPHREFLEAARAEKSDLTLQKLCDRLRSEKGVKADTSMMSRFFRRIGVTLKKRRSSRANKTGRTSAGIGRAGEPIRAASIPPASSLSTRPSGRAEGRLWAKTNMTRLYGWAPKGERLIDKVPHGHWETATFLAALRSDRIDAPCLFDGPINGERFRAYVEQFLVPTLKAGDVVILDNLGSHKGKAVRKAIRDVGARLVFLPKYSPDLNPIEQLFAKFKTLLRKVGARTYEAISAACGEILKRALSRRVGLAVRPVSE